MLYDVSECIILFVFISFVVIFMFVEYNNCLTMEREYKKFDTSPVKDSKFEQSFQTDRDVLAHLVDDTV